MLAASLGIIADIMVNQHYPSEEAYLYALADAMKTEYEAIATAGLVVQIDAPDAAMGRHGQFRNESLETFRNRPPRSVSRRSTMRWPASPGEIRYHICWGNYEGPHTHDVPLADVADLLLAVRAGAYSVEAANPRHAHEWQVWEYLPDDKILIPGRHRLNDELRGAPGAGGPAHRTVCADRRARARDRQHRLRLRQAGPRDGPPGARLGENGRVGGGGSPGIEAALGPYQQRGRQLLSASFDGQSVRRDNPRMHTTPCQFQLSSRRRRDLTRRCTGFRVKFRDRRQSPRCRVA